MQRDCNYVLYWLLLTCELKLKNDMTSVKWKMAQALFVWEGSKVDITPQTPARYRWPSIALTKWQIVPRPTNSFFATVAEYGLLPLPPATQIYF